MTVQCDLTIDGRRIGSVYATREAGTGTDPDDVNPYVCGVLEADGSARWRGRIWHRYGDGAWELVERVLRASRSPSIEIPVEVRHGA